MIVRNAMARQGMQRGGKGEERKGKGSEKENGKTGRQERVRHKKYFRNNCNKT